MTAPNDPTGKQTLREHYRVKRRTLNPIQKKSLDAAVLRNVLSLPEYQSCSLVLCYISMAREVDTYALMRAAWEADKRVAVPRIRDDGGMDFHQIENHRALVSHSFGVLEPDPLRSIKLPHYPDAVCIVPGLSFDQSGYRLGYGGGYYDRFLGGPFQGSPAIGICYSSFLSPELPHEPHDIPCTIVVHDQGVLRV